MSVLIYFVSEVTHIYKDFFPKNGKCDIFPALYIVGEQSEPSMFYDLYTASVGTSASP